MNDATMPLLESLIPQCRCAQDTVVLHINHCMDNSFYFTEQLQKAFGQIIFVAVPYNDRNVPEGLSYTAYHGMPEKNRYVLMKNNRRVEDCSGDFLHAVRRMIALALNNEIKNLMEQGKYLLIVEDGGYHYPVLWQWLAKNPSLTKNVLGCVEQTTAGIRAGVALTMPVAPIRAALTTASGSRANTGLQIPSAGSRASTGLQSPPDVSRTSTGLKNPPADAGDNMGLLYPVASVARSAYKVRVEAYFVADRVVGELKRMLRRQGSFVDFHHVLLLGYGIIGRSVASCMKTHHVQMSVCDTDDEVLQSAKADGLKLWNGDFFGDMLVLGNVGKPSFTKAMLDQFLHSPARRIYLASASSKQVEFEDIFDRLADAQKIPMYQADAYRFSCGREVVLLAQGFPLNFYDKSSDSLTYDMIDPVFSEMLLCAKALREQREELEKRIYLFGIDEALGGSAAEKSLLGRWMAMNHIYLDIDTFNRHPKEAHLREKAMEGK